MTDASTTPPGAGAPASLAEMLDRELEGLDRELTEIEMLVGQSRTEAGRHEQKRAQAAERLAGLGAGAPPADLAEANAQLVTLTRRAAVMESQLDVLAGKQKTLERYRDGLARVREAVVVGDGHAGATGAAATGADDGGAVDGAGPVAVGAPPSVGRVILAAQEDLRRDIARAMHDGPAQSLTNIVLQAQIVERLLERDPAAAAAGVRELTAMVQRTLEATKAFIFDMRPMVLDDLGLVPTLRRVARDRSRRAGVPVEFESLGTDRRLPMELESAIFRVADESVAALLGGQPEKVVITLDWGEELEVAVRAVHPASSEVAVEGPRADMPAALRAMVDERQARAVAQGVIAVLTPAIRREIDERAAAAGGRVEFGDDGRGVTARFPLPAAPTDA
jgi:two-component system, NarL family, sensor histidine kinase DegS